MSETFEPNSFEDFNQRFYDLMLEAEKYGIDSITALVSWDPLEPKQESVSSAYNWHCARPTAIGLCEIFKHKLMATEVS